ncbi:hypothetical protein F5877DRAFT_67704 [Lentinula edodes]|nr:hypothetical protein F5877DRAFT_67704 [Lentinula edodes]
MAITQAWSIRLGRTNKTVQEPCAFPPRFHYYLCYFLIVGSTEKINGTLERWNLHGVHVLGAFEDWDHKLSAIGYRSKTSLVPEEARDLMTLHLLPDQPRLLISRNTVGRLGRTASVMGANKSTSSLLSLRLSASAFQLCRGSAIDSNWFWIRIWKSEKTTNPTLILQLLKPVGRDSPAPTQLELLRYLNKGFDERRWCGFFHSTGILLLFAAIEYPTTQRSALGSLRPERHIFSAAVFGFSPFIPTSIWVVYTSVAPCVGTSAFIVLYKSYMQELWPILATLTWISGSL